MSNKKSVYNISSVVNTEHSTMVWWKIAMKYKTKIVFFSTKFCKWPFFLFSLQHSPISDIHFQFQPICLSRINVFDIFVSYTKHFLPCVEYVIYSTICTICTCISITMKLFDNYESFSHNLILEEVFIVQIMQRIWGLHSGLVMWQFWIQNRSFQSSIDQCE